LENNITGYIKIANQNYGEGVTHISNDKWEEDNKSNKIFVDNAYINVDNIFSLPINIRLGRQNLIYGSGFVIFDGQSQFASTSIYFDGIKLTWNLYKYANLDILYIKDEERKPDATSNDDITLGGLYLKGDIPIIGQSQEIYFLNRNDETLNKNIYMYGARFSDKLDCGFDYSVESALQNGEFNKSVKHNALGGKFDLGFAMKNAFAQPRIFLGFVSLSGDNNSTTSTNEAWDVFYGGWPQFGDILAWKYVNLGPLNVISVYDSSYNSGSSTIGEAVYSNFSLMTIGINFQLFENISAKMSASQIIINEADNNLSNKFGNFFQLDASYKYSENLSFRIYAGLIQPGEIFTSNSDNASEIYWEAKLKF
jgi:alginate export protein